MISSIRYNLGLVLLAIFLTNCTQTISEETSQQLGNVTRFAASTLGAPANVQRTALTQATKNQKLCEFLSGGTIQLSQTRKSINISPIAVEQEKTGQQLLRYLNSLEEASRGASIAELTAARQEFLSEVSEFETAATGSTKVSPFVISLSNLISKVGESRRQARIRGIMTETTDALEILSALVERDVSDVIINTEKAIAAWDQAAICLLRSVKSRSDAIEIYEMLDEQRREFNAQLITIQRGPVTVNSLVDAHLLAENESASFEQVLQQIITVTEETKNLIDTVEGI